MAGLEASRVKWDQFHLGYRYWKAKAVCYLAKLFFIPWLRDLLWAFGFQWSFENCRYLTVHREEFNIDPTTVGSDFLDVPAATICEMVNTSRDLIPNAPVAPL